MSNCVVIIFCLSWKLYNSSINSEERKIAYNQNEKETK